MPAAHRGRDGIGLDFPGGQRDARQGAALLVDDVAAQRHERRLRGGGTRQRNRENHGLPGVEQLGPQSSDAVFDRMRTARALILPSICYENFPRTLVEAYACGLPVIASRLGAMAALVQQGQTGLLFNPGDAADLARVLAWALAHPEELARMGQQARRQYELELTGASNYRQLLNIYEEAVACHATH